MNYAVANGEGIVKVVGEVGSGKTTLCRMLIKELPEYIEVVYLANPSLSPDEILHAIAFELKLNVSSDDGHLKVMNELQKYLLEQYAQNKRIVVFIEEAQSMLISTLEEIRLLSNLETDQHKLLQIVMFGQPELDDMLAKQEIRQLKERITYSFHLKPFSQHNVRDYINARLYACGYRGEDLFTKLAIRAIARYSKGLLRRVNILSDKSLLAAYSENLKQVNTKQVAQAALDTECISSISFYLQRWSVLGIFLVVIIILVLSLVLLEFIFGV